MASISQLSALQELLIPANKEASDEGNIRSTSSELKRNVQTPGHIGPAPPAKETLQHINKAEKQSKDIWNEEEVPECELPSDDLDAKIVPEYEILFKQNITSEDIFLGMRNKNPSTACCEDLAVKIYLPEARYADVNLNVTDTYLDCQTPKYKLGLHFPQRVESKSGKAQWDSDKCLLTITAPLRREYDFLNVHSR